MRNNTIKLHLRNAYQDYFQSEKDKVDRNYLLGIIEGCWISGQIPNKEDYQYLTEYALDEELEKVFVRLDDIFLEKKKCFKYKHPRNEEQEIDLDNIFDGLLPKEESKKEKDLEINMDNIFEGLI